MGMAVDANVIIYERIKEELAAGKGLGKAVADGYKNAYSAIIDGQVTTLLTGIVLFVFGSGPVQLRHHVDHRYHHLCPHLYLHHKAYL